MKYRSGWELTVAKFLDNDPLVLSYEYESLKIPYISNKQKKTTRNYIPDFIVEYKDGRKVIIEVKRVKSLTNLMVKKKAEAAKLWASQNGYEYVFWTDNIIKALQKIEKIREKNK